jgi:hypothetical protein
MRHLGDPEKTADGTLHDGILSNTIEASATLKLRKLYSSGGVFLKHIPTE